MKEEKEKYYIVSANELKALIRDQMILTALEQGGVDNWGWYGESIEQYEEDNGKIPRIENIDLDSFEELKY